MMKFTISFLVLLLMGLTGVNAKILNNEVVIDSLFQASEGIYEFNILVEIPRNSDSVILTIDYDETHQKKLQDIAWVVKPIPSFFSKLLRKQRAAEKRLFPYRKEEFVRLDPDFKNLSLEKKYDYFTSPDRSYKNQYFFYKKDLIKKLKQRNTNFLEFHFADGSVRAINLDDYLFNNRDLYPGEKFFPSFFGSGIKKNPVFAPNPVLPKNAR